MTGHVIAGRMSRDLVTRVLCSLSRDLRCGLIGKLVGGRGLSANMRYVTERRVS